MHNRNNKWTSELEGMGLGDLKEWVEGVVAESQKEIAQDCYLQCIAAESGEGECGEAIATKYPDLVSRIEEEEEQTNESIIEISTVKPNQSWELSANILDRLTEVSESHGEATLHLNTDLLDLSITFKRGI